MLDINRFGTIFYYNNEGQLHRSDGPAIVTKDGWKQYWYKGKFISVTEEEYIKFILSSVIE